MYYGKSANTKYDNPLKSINKFQQIQICGKQNKQRSFRNANSTILYFIQNNILRNRFTSTSNDTRVIKKKRRPTKPTNGST